MRPDSGATPCIFIIAGESSGDELGAKLIVELKAAHPGCRVSGIGGPAMERAGLESLFPMSDIAVMGIVPVIARLRLLLRRIREAAAATVASTPDVLVIIDSPDFTHRVAKRVRRVAPQIPIIDYVSPTVWAWRPGRARRMRAYVDHLLTLLPFEPAAHRRLGGPPCTYVGHPLVERIADLRPAPGEIVAPDLMLVLPGSRRSEVRRLMPVFGDTVARIAHARTDMRFVLPAVPHVRDQIVEAMADWPVKAEVVDGEAAKYAAFRQAFVALAASGTVTLELALAQVPMIVAYKASSFEKKIFDLFVTVPSVILPNLVIDAKPIPEFLQERCTAELLAEALLPLLSDTPERQAQMAAFVRVSEVMQAAGQNPSRKAAEIVLDHANTTRHAPS